MRQISFPVTNMCFNYFYDGELDVEVLCQALSTVLAELPFLGGQVRGSLYVSLIQHVIHIICEDDSRPVTVG